MWRGGDYKLSNLYRWSTATKSYPTIPSSQVRLWCTTMARGMNLCYISGAVGIIDTAAVLLRFVARRKSKAKFGVDDIFMACSLLPLYSMIVLSVLRAYSYISSFLVLHWLCILYTVITKGGLGRPMATLTPTEIYTFFKVCFDLMWQKVSNK